MKTRTRFIKSVIVTAGTQDIQMPWTRGARRDAFIARRKAAQVEQRQLKRA